MALIYHAPSLVRSRMRQTGARARPVQPAGKRQTMFKKLHAVARQVSQIVVGKDLQVRQALTCLLAGGHLLVEDVPGVGKTTLAHALAISLGLKFNRVQFTSDLLPADVAGISMYERETERLRVPPRPDLHPGAAGRRDQPRHAEDPVRPARSDGRAPGQRRRRHARAARTVLRDRHPEPGAPGRHLPAAGIAAGPLPDVPLAGLSRTPPPNARC